jgi:hypothetical protein
MRRRAERQTVTRFASQLSAVPSSSASTGMTPEECPIRTSPPVVCPATSWGTVPGIRAASASAVLPVAGIAWWTRPIETMRVIRSTSDVWMARPPDTACARGGLTMATFGLAWWSRDASAADGARPMTTAASARTASRRRSAPASELSTDRSSTPLNPRSRAATNTQGFPASSIVALTSPMPSTSMVSTRRPVGSSRPVMLPPGLMKSRRILAAGYGTPSR